MKLGGFAGPSGSLQARLIRAKTAPLSWRIRNALRWMFIKGWIANELIAPFANMWGVTTITTDLRIKVRRLIDPIYIQEYRRLRAEAGETPDETWFALRETFLQRFGEWTDYGIVGRRVITDAGVAYLVDDWDGGADDMNEYDFHGCGTGTTAENANQTALVTESTTALNPNSTRASGTNSQPAANQFRTIGTLTFDADAAVTEHGIFDQAATGGGSMWDRTVFSAINVVGANGDSIQFTYTATVSSGG